MANYCGQRFIKDYASITHDLRELTKADSGPWCWEPRHQRALDNLKKELARASSLSYFDPRKEIEVVVDASPYGISAVLAQKDKSAESHDVIHFASRPLTPTEQRYSQIEREALAIICVGM